MLSVMRDDDMKSGKSFQKCGALIFIAVGCFKDKRKALGIGIIVALVLMTSVPELFHFK